MLLNEIGAMYFQEKEGGWVFPVKKKKERCFTYQIDAMQYSEFF